MVLFDKEAHSYTNSETGRKYISVSQLLSLYKEPFDRDYFAAKVAKRQGVSKEKVISEWVKTNKDACDKGTSIHEIIENYIKTGEILEQDYELVKSLEDVFNRNDYKNILSEELVYSDHYEVAGTSDLICGVDENYFDVLDVKTNKKFEFYSKYGKHLKTPLNNLQQCQYNDYSLQLSLYAYLYSGLTDKKVRKICILYHDGKKFISYPAPYLFWEVSALLKHYSLNHGQKPDKQS